MIYIPIMFCPLTVWINGCNGSPLYSTGHWPFEAAAQKGSSSGGKVDDDGGVGDASGLPSRR